MEYEDIQKGLTEEQVAKARACKSADELVKLAEETGIELSDKQLEEIAGGGFWDCSDNYWP